jgi:alpha-galactosidase
VGLDVLSAVEERFHFGMWAINKSPLTLGFPISGTAASTLQIVSNQEVISINQDSLGKQAQLIRRYTEEEWDIWAGELSGSRMVVGLANWRNSPRSISFDLGNVLGISSAKTRDVWASTDLGLLSGTYTVTLEAHELKLLVLSNIVKSTAVRQSKGYYGATNAAISGAAQRVTCSTTQCLPSQAKIGNIGQGSSAAAVTFTGVSATTAGRKLIGVDFINYDVALESAWSGGTNTRNMTISVNGGTAKRWAFPISGGNWYDTGRMLVEMDGFQAGRNNQVVFRASGTTSWAPDLVGFEVFE